MNIWIYMNLSINEYETIFILIFKQYFVIPLQFFFYKWADKNKQSIYISNHEFSKSWIMMICVDLWAGKHRQYDLHVLLQVCHPTNFILFKPHLTCLQHEARTECREIRKNECAGIILTTLFDKTELKNTYPAYVICNILTYRLGQKEQ